MPILPFDDDTFVAFLDISGFKELMRQNNAIRALNRLYQIGFDTIRDGARIEGLFVSDSGILFVRKSGNNYEDLKNLLGGIKRINRELLRDNFMTTTSIAYGHFKYQDKIEIPGIEKNAVYGGAYVEAFLDSEKTEPRIKAGQVRLLIKDLPIDVTTILDIQTDEFSCFLKKKGRHYYYYWSLENYGDINELDRKYSDSYKLVFQGILNALKGE